MAATDALMALMEPLQGQHVGYQYSVGIRRTMPSAA